jgi:hypothetical protein
VTDTSLNAKIHELFLERQLLLTIRQDDRHLGNTHKRCTYRSRIASITGRNLHAGCDQSLGFRGISY